MPKLTQKRLKELLHYDSETGVFTWLASGPGININRVAGTITRGYRIISINGKLYRAARLAWLYMEGYFPEHEVDHKNRCTFDDAWKNLRHTSHLCNMQNKTVYKNNKSGITGVCWHKREKKWETHITISGKTIYLGTFKSIIDAAKARWNAEIKHGFPNCNTISAAYLYLKSHGGF